LRLPAALGSEFELRRHVEALLAKNASTADHLSFLGGGAWQHYVPAVVDAVIGRDEFLTAYGADAYGDHGKYQAMFETASMLGELLEMDAVSTSTYDWANAAAAACRMATRLTARSRVLVAATTSPNRLAVIENYAGPAITVDLIAWDRRTGRLDLAALSAMLRDDVAAVYFENPSYLGFLEDQAAEIARLAHGAGAGVIVGVDPSSLGVVRPPATYGADIVCGDLQPLGVHLQWGGGLSGFIAMRDEQRYLDECPLQLFGLAETTAEGEYGFGKVLSERTSYAAREQGKDFVGTVTALHAIAAGVYLALLGPQGMRELGAGIAQRRAYLVSLLRQLPGVQAPHLSAPGFKEVVVGFDGTGRTVREINAGLRARGIFGGKNLSREFPELGESALYAVTEVHSAADIERLAAALGEVLAR
jgi:glycine dehydrogenase subunit 1